MIPDYALGGAFGTLTAFWLGVLAAISPCGLATNIAAIAFIGKNMRSPSRTMWSGLFYTLGRTFTYVLIGALLVAGIGAIHEVSQFLQATANRFLGPILILSGMVMLDLLPIDLPERGFVSRFQNTEGKGGMLGAFGIGLLFALAFCPVSAALFFGGLIPLALAEDSSILYPLLFGAGTAIPVAAFALVLGFGAHSLSRIFAAITAVELWARRVTGSAFIGIGIYYTLVYSFQLFR